MKPIEHVWEHIRDNWINGNRADVRRIVTTLSKRDTRRLILHALNDCDIDAMAELYCVNTLREILTNVEAYEK